MIHQRSLAPFITPQLGPAQRMNELGICRTFSDMGNELTALIVAQRKSRLTRARASLRRRLLTCTTDISGGF